MPRMLGRASIRVRLTAWYAAALFVAFSTAALGVRQVVGIALQDEFEDALVNAAGFVQTFFGFEVSEYPSIEITASHLVEELVFPEREVEILRPDGTRVQPPRSARRRPRGVTGPARAVMVPLDSALAPGWRVRVTASTAPIDRPLARLDLWLLGAIAASVAAAAAGGWGLAGRALRPIGAMAAATDRITAAPQGERLPVANPHDELGRLGTRVNALLDRLDGALALQRQFLADAAHELRTPIARMRGRVDLALQAAVPAGAANPLGGEVVTDDDARRTLEDIEEDLARTTVLVDELLQLARADAGVRPPQLVPAFLDDVVMESLRGWHAAVERRGQRLTVDGVEEAPARLDAILIDRLVGILLDNASRYTPPAGSITVRVLRERGAAVLEVRDTGIGITEDEQRHVFERFFRGARARSLVPDGSGLGLAIAAWIARVHDADLTLAPNDDVGTLARVRFPPCAEPLAGPPAQRLADAEGTAGA